MTPEKAIKALILSQAVAAGDIELSGPVLPENVDALYDEKLVEAERHYDYESELRGGTVETNLPCDYSRHYESKSVAMQLPNGRWIGWTYWYGGGKHGEPEAIDWMNEAYFLDCAEEEKTVTVRTFTKKTA